MPNRITLMIERQKAIIEDRIATGLTTQTKAEEARKNLDMDPDMYCDFQNRKSLASIDGTLTLDEAQLVYGFLGETPDHFNAQPLEVKAVLTKLYHELLQKALRARGVRC